MTRFILLGSLGIAMYTGFVYMVYKTYEPPKEIRIDCSTAEFSPDFTAQMREACRNSRRHKL